MIAGFVDACDRVAQRAGAEVIRIRDLEKMIDVDINVGGVVGKVVVGHGRRERRRADVVQSVSR